MVWVIPRALLTLTMLFTLGVFLILDPFWRATLGELLHRLGDWHTPGVLGRGEIHPFTWMHAINTKILTWIENGKRASEKAVVVQLNALIDSAALLIGVPLAIALTLFDLAKIVGAKAVGAVTHIDVGKITRPIYKAVAAVRAEGIRWRRTFYARLRALERRIAHAATATAGAIAKPFPRIGALERKVAAQGKRLTRLEKAALAAVGVGSVALALGRLGLGWLRCNNVKRTGKRVCGMNPDLLDGLLASTLLLTGAISIRTLARELREPTDIAASALGSLVTELGDVQAKSSRTPR